MKYFIPLLSALILCTATNVSAQKDTTQKSNDQSQDLIPTITATSDDLSESMSNENISSMLASTRDIYAATAAFRLRQAGFRYRGYNNDEFTTIINGVLMNDPENGGVFWGSIGAFNDMTHNRGGNIGLSPSSYAFGGLGGSYHIDTRPGTQRPGLNIAYTATDRNYSNRLSASYSTGYLKGGWALSMAFSRRWAVAGYEPGTYFDGYGYFFAVEKKLGEKQTLTLTTYGTPTTSARAAAAVSEMQNLANDKYYNPDWGYQNGQVRSSNVNKRFQPAFMLTHEAKLSNKTNILTGVDFEFGKNRTSLIDYYNSATPDPAYYRNLPSFNSDPTQSALEASILSNNVDARQIKWDQLYAANRTQPIGANGRQSSYVTADRVEDAQKFNLNSTINHTFNDMISITGGITYQWEKVRNYKELTDLLGGDYFVNLNNFAIQDFPTNPQVLQNDVLHPNRILHIGDSYGYDYYSQIHKGSIWIQPYFRFKKVEFFVSGQLTDSYYWRTGNVENGLFPTGSLGDSKKVNMFNYAVKAGVQYKINGKNYLYLNATTKSVAPSFRNTFISPDTRNDLVPNLTSENVYSAELGYQYKSQKFKLKASLFYTQTLNEIKSYTFFHEDYRTNVNYNLSGINTRQYGVEIGAEAKIYKGFSADLIANIGKYQFADNPKATISQDNSNTILESNQTSYLKNFYLGGSPQMSYSLGLKYTGKKNWFVELDLNYFDWMFVEVNPVRRTLQAIDLVPYGSDQYNQIMHQEQLKGQFTMDLKGGYSWLLNRTFKKLDDAKKRHNYYIVINATLSNLTNNQNLVTNGREQLRYDFAQKNINEFATKYRYMHGFGYFISLTFRMQ